MQDLIDNLLNELRSAWRFRRYALLVAWGVCLLGWPVVYAIPDKYEARARVNVDTRTPLQPLLQGIAIDQDVQSQINQVRQALFGGPNLERVAQEAGMDLTGKTPRERQDIIGGLRSRIQLTLEPQSGGGGAPNNFYRITFQDRDQAFALKLVDVLLNSFVESTMGTGRQGTANAQRFLQEQLREYDRILADAEARLAEFKKRNMGLVPGEEGDYFQRLQNEVREIQRLESALSVATSRRAELERQLRGASPYVPPTDGAVAGRSGSTPGQPQDTASRIQETRARLDELLLRFTERHPDVIAARETLAALEERQRAELEALRRGDPDAAAVTGASANPIYQSIQLQLNEVDVEIAALRGQLADHRRSEARLRQLVDTVPEVEAEYARLTRDYDVTRATYNTLLERLERARLSGDAEATGIVKFDIVDPPSVSFGPVSPNRPVLLLGVLVVGLGAGGAIAWLMHMLKPVFFSARSLAEVTGLDVLGTVSAAWVDKQRAAVRRGVLRYSAASAALLAAFVVAVAVQGRASRFFSQLLG
ncbi:MAG: chain-length determining protein [Proteobacteria bacterium]|nr:MAG: chain-length determining protein [Pseudomonadota bacterium]